MQNTGAQARTRLSIHCQQVKTSTSTMQRKVEASSWLQVLVDFFRLFLECNLKWRGINKCAGSTLCPALHTHIHTYTHTHIHTYTHTHIHTYIHTYICIDIYIHGPNYVKLCLLQMQHLNTAPFTYIHIHTYAYICIHIHTQWDRTTVIDQPRWGHSILTVINGGYNGDIKEHKGFSLE